MKKETGFTLMELIITLALIGITLAIGVPSLKTFMNSNRLVSASNELISAMHIARSEAIKLNSSVTLCESSDGSTCSATGKWQDGWIVFVDRDRDKGGTGNECDNLTKNTDCLLRVHASFNSPDLTIKGVYDSNNTVKITYFTFTSRGLPKDSTGASLSGSMNVCNMDGTTVVGERAVVLSLSGRVRVTDDAAVITCP